MSTVYSPHLVTYLDILGFRNLIEQKSPKFISGVIQLWKHETTPRKDDRHYGEDYKRFSDLIVGTCPVNSKVNAQHRPGLVFVELYRVMFAQVRMIEGGILLRGAVTVGDLVKNNREIYGPALIRAYELESQVAVVPRIVVDDRLLTEMRGNPLLRRHSFKEEMEYLSPLLRKDEEHITFVDYLNGVLPEDPDGAPIFLKKHKDLIERGLWDFRNDTRIRKKFRWLQRYHNSYVQTLPKGMRKNLRSD